MLNGNKGSLLDNRKQMTHFNGLYPTWEILQKIIAVIYDSKKKVQSSNNLQPPGKHYIYIYIYIY